MYAGAGAALSLGGLLARSSFLPRWLRTLVGAGVGGVGFYFVGSLAVSHWVYDRSALYGWRWLARFVSKEPGRIVNVHAGFDESTGALRNLYPSAVVTPVDFYDPVRNPEPSIARARRAHPVDPATVRVGLDGWPLATGSADLVVLFLAAHEVRTVADRRRLFGQVRRVCGADARVVVVEHLRDAANFAAYGPGFFHFHSQDAWRRSFGPGLEVVDEAKITPFIHVFGLRVVGGGV